MSADVERQPEDHRSPNLYPVDSYRWEIPSDYKPGMRVPGLVYADAALLPQILADHALEQVANVATLPGIVGRSIAMPDIHWGYGFPVGGVAAMDAEHGVISPGGVGYDINCGVRLAIVPVPFAHIKEEMKQTLIHKIFELVPDRKSTRLNSSHSSK